MNIFAKAIFTSHPTLKDILISRLEIEFSESIGEINIYKKVTPEWSTLVIFAPAKEFEAAVVYLKENYDILKMMCIGIGVPTDSLDLKMWDVMVPNTFINKNNDAVFNEYVVDQNYDLNAFGLVLNGICLSLDTQIQTEEELADIKENYACEIMDFEAFFQAETLQKHDLTEKSVIIKSIWSSQEELTHWVDILQLMME